MISPWFILGHEPLLSLAELHSVFPNTTFTLLHPLVATAEQSFDANTLIRQLGGTVKIASELQQHLALPELLEAIAADLQTVEGKIHFGLSVYGGGKDFISIKQIETWGLQLKKRLKADGRSVRYVDNREAPQLSSVSVEKNGLVGRGREYIIIARDGRFALGRTLAVQPFEALSTRDFGRPGRDDVSGMLPPKLAMMMLNCAGADKKSWLYDPSCGSGTIVTEAMLLGFQKIAGSDLSAKAVADSRKNIEYTEQSLTTKPTVTVFEQDIQTPIKNLPAQSVASVVTEPFLGPPLRGRESADELLSNLHALAKLYVATFKTLTTVLQPGGTIIFILPRFSSGQKIFRSADLVVPKLAELGFKPVPLLPTVHRTEPFILYQRPGQHVGREIWKFTR